MASTNQLEVEAMSDIAVAALLAVTVLLAATVSVELGISSR
jgi:FlaG/FlaF family flagellin (archaellin)